MRKIGERGRMGKSRKTCHFSFRTDSFRSSVNNEISSSPDTSHTSHTSQPAIFIRLMGKE